MRIDFPKSCPTDYLPIVASCADLEQQNPIDRWGADRFYLARLSGRALRGSPLR